MADIRWFSIGQCLRVCVLCFVISFGTCISMNSNCLEVKKAYAEKGFDESEVPNTAVSGADLSICPQEESCCTPNMEENLLSLSLKEHDNEMDKAFKILRSTFASKTRKFDDFFKELLSKARQDLHEMFSKTYGLLYKQNADIFTDLFNDLEAYYNGKSKNLSQVMGTFFTRLFQKMFQLMNPHNTFDKEYLSCITSLMADLKPADDVPPKLSRQVRRAFIAARTFVQGLAVGRDVITTVMQIAPTDNCVKAVVKMRYCPHCRSWTNTKPCNNYCLNTMKGCLANHAELNGVWNAYIDALHSLAERLEGPFNIEAVVDPIDVKISEAIMNIQESNEKIKQKIYSSCGKPPLARKKREASGRQSFTFDYPGTTQVRPTTAAGTSLDRLVRDIKNKVMPAKDFWVQLPYTVCNDEEVAADPSSEDDCWNGQDRAKYIPSVQKDGLIQQINNPEVEVDVSKVNTVVTRQKLQLQLVTARLQEAYRGDDVEWMDTEIEGLSSGSGSGDYDVPGSGSGYGAGRPTDDEDDFEIKEDDGYTTDNTGYGFPGRGGGERGNGKDRGSKGEPDTSDTETRYGGEGSDGGDRDRASSSDRDGQRGVGGRTEGKERPDEGRREEMAPEDGAGHLSSMPLGVLVLVAASLHMALRRLLC